MMPETGLKRRFTSIYNAGLLSPPLLFCTHAAETLTQLELAEGQVTYRML